MIVTCWSYYELSKTANGINNIGTPQLHLCCCHHSHIKACMTPIYATQNRQASSEFQNLKTTWGILVEFCHCLSQNSILPVISLNFALLNFVTKNKNLLQTINITDCKFSFLIKQSIYFRSNFFPGALLEAFLGENCLLGLWSLWDWRSHSLPVYKLFSPC
jgi:hypothetical protein